MTKTKIVHCLKEDYDVYVGRGRCPKTGFVGLFGNPYTHISTKDTMAEHIVESREEAVEKYRKHLLADETLIGEVLLLDGKTLGCWCGEKLCHGSVIIEIINSKKYSLF